MCGVAEALTSVCHNVLYASCTLMDYRRDTQKKEKNTKRKTEREIHKD